MAHDRLSAATRRAFWLLAACGAAMASGGCGQADPANDAVQRAALEINTLSLGGANPMPAADMRVTAYRRIVADLQPHTSAATPNTASAANMLVARAYAGLAGVETDAVADAEQRALDLIDSVRIHLDRYTAEQAQVASVETYDPAPHLADLDKQIKDKDAEIAQAWSEKSALDTMLADLESEAAAATDRANQERAQETALRQQAINATAVEQAELISRASEHKRAADAHDKESSLLRAQAAQRAPEGVTLQAEIDRLTDQRKLLEDAKAEIHAFAKSNTDRAATGRADAMAAAEQVRRLADELATLRDAIPDTADEAAEQYDRAIRAAAASGQAGGEARASAAITQAINQHAKADLLALRVRGLSAYADLLGALAEATPPLPEAATYQARAEAADADAQRLTAEALELYIEAQEAYRQAGERGSASEHFERLARSMEALTGKSMGEPPAPEVEPIDEPAAADPIDADPEAEVRAMLASLTETGAEGDLAKLLPFLDLSEPGMKAMMDATIELDAACREKFNKTLIQVGEDMAAQMGGAGGAPGGMGMAGPAGMEFDQFTIIVDSPESVTLVPPGGNDDVKVSATKMGGQWKIRMELPPEMAPLIEGMAGVYRNLAADIRSGAVGTPEQIGPAMMQHMMPLIMEMQRQGGG